jgi:hypothetical protein
MAEDGSDRADLEVAPGPSVTVLGADSAPISATLQIGAAGIYPPVTARAEPTRPAPLPHNHAHLIGGGRPAMYTLLVRSDDERLAAWGDVTPDDQGRYTIQLTPALPLAIKVLRADGSPAPRATVTVRRSQVDLLRIQQTSGPDGVARLGALPPGAYHVDVQAPGATRAAQLIQHIAGQTPTIQLASARAIAGRVVDPRGQPVRGAIVTAHLDRWGTPAALDVRDLERVRRLPTLAWVDAEPDGAFTIDQLPAGVLYLTAVAPGFVPRLSQPIDLRKALAAEALTLTLTPGRTVHVRVAGEDGTPAAQADVLWSDISGAQGHAMTDAEGKVTLEGLPSTARIAAELDRWSASPKPLHPSAASLDLVLKPPGERRELKLRFSSVPDGVAITRLEVRGAGGEVCEAERILPATKQDWRLKRCVPGRVTLEVRTAAHGTAMFEARLDEVSEVAMPTPTPVVVEVSAPPRVKPSLDWQEAGLRGELKRDERVEGLWRWRGALYPGRYGLRVSAQDGGYEELVTTLVVGDAQVEERYALAALAALPVVVVDRRDKPLTNAFITLWEGAVLRDSAVSAGAQAVQLRTTSGATGQIVAFSARDGEGQASATAGQRAVVALDQPAHALAKLPGRLTDRAVLARRLGAPIIEDSGGWRLDVTDPTSAAARAGIPRGAYLLVARATADGLWVVVCDTDASAPRALTIHEH